MNKYIKRIIAGITIINAFIMTTPMVSINLIQPDIAYASAKPYLKKIYVDSGYDINFAYNTYTYNLKVSNYLNEITIKARAEKLSDIVRINGIVVNKENKYKQTIKLDKEVNKIEIEVEDSDDSDNITTYTLYIKKGYITPADDLNEVTNANEVFLDNITLDGDEIGFKKRKYTYNIQIDDYNDEIPLTVEPEYDTDIIKVNGRKLGKNNTVVLGLRSEGKYVITIIVEDAESNQRGTYTLNLYKGIKMPEKPEVIPNQPPKMNQWVRLKGKWQYNDSLGQPIKNMWFFDSNYNEYFYLDESGNMKTGWFYYKDSWYYLREDGTMKTGWMCQNKNWYYFNDYGEMQKGWAEIGNDWYYFDDDGTMMTYKWVYTNNHWYYLTSTGEMLHNHFLSSKGKLYYLNEDGTMQSTRKEINGYVFDFNSYGSIILN